MKGLFQAPDVVSRAQQSLRVIQEESEGLPVADEFNGRSWHCKMQHMLQSQNLDEDRQQHDFHPPKTEL